MPYSSTNGKRFISSCIELIENKYRPSYQLKVLDLGAGSGTYSDLYRSRLKGKWTAVEIWKPYIEQFQLESKYDEVLVMDAFDHLESLEELDIMYDVIFLGDMLEHMPKEKAIQLIKLLKDALYTPGAAFISVPIGEYPQEAYLGNPYEEHVATWHKEDLESLRGFLVHYEREIGVTVLGSLHVDVAAYLIGKNEEKFIERCLNSLEMIEVSAFVDTGSTDQTLELARKICAQTTTAYFAPFRFDDARNVALGLTSLAYDYVLSIDCDERVVSFEIAKFQNAVFDYLCETGYLPDLIHHKFKTIWNWDDEAAPKNITSHFHSRLHRRVGCRWVHPVHEKLTWFKGSPREMWFLDLELEQLPDTKKDRSSYLNGLRIAVKEDPTDWKLLIFLADETTQLGFDEPEGYLQQAFKLPDADKAFISLKQGFLHERYGKPTAAAHFADAAFRCKCREMVVHQAEYETRRGNHDYANRLWAEAKELKHETQGYLRREDCWNGSIPQLSGP